MPPLRVSFTQEDYMAFEFEPSVMIESLPLLMGGAKMTVILTVGGLFFGFILGAVAGMMKLSRNFWVRKLAGVYVETIRGTPMLVQAMFLYFGVPMALGIRIPGHGGGYYHHRRQLRCIHSRDRTRRRPVHQHRTGRSRPFHWPDPLSDHALRCLAPKLSAAMIPPLGNPVHHQPSRIHLC